MSLECYHVSSMQSNLFQTHEYSVPVLGAMSHLNTSVQLRSVIKLGMSTLIITH